MLRKCFLSCTILFIAMLLLSFIAMGCNEQVALEEDFASEYRSYPDGFVLNVVNGTDLTKDGVIFLENASDDLFVQFANLTKDNSEFVLKLFLDYEEVNFLIGEVSYSSFEFKVAAEESKEIQVNLDTTVDLGISHMLTVGVFTAPNKHASEIELMSNSYGMVLTYEIVSPSGSRTNIRDMHCEKTAKFLKSQFQGIMLNEDFLNEDNDTVQFPPIEVAALPGKNISLAYRLGNYNYQGNVMLIVLVDWKQVSVNGSDYLIVENKPGYIGFGEIEITAPLDSGKYEVIAFAVNQPFSPRNVTNFFAHDTAYRFTLSVDKK